MLPRAIYSICALFLVLSAPVFALTLPQITRLPPFDAAGIYAFGDTDHDGHYEVISTWRDSTYTFFYRILEEQGQNVYTEEYRGAEAAIHAAGDLDGDGKSDLVAQWGSEIRVYEAVSPNDYPTQLVWTYPSSNVLAPITIADTDRDGRCEIIQCMSTGTHSSLIRIFESVGDDSYELVYSLSTHQAKKPVIGDFDGDGFIEIAYCGSTPSPPYESEMTVIESTADNTWTVTFSAASGLATDGDAVGGTDTDGNSRPELFFYGLHADPVGRAVAVYEPVGDNMFERVAMLFFDDGSTGVTPCSMGNIDGQGPEELLLEGLDIRIYRPIAVGAWTLAGIIKDPTRTQVWARLFDVNRNGLPELFWPSGASDAASTYVFEYDSTATSVQELASSPPTGTFIIPNPCRSVITMFAPDLAHRVATISVFDVRGRLLERAIPVHSPGGTLTWTPQRLAAGVYLIRAETSLREPLGTRRLVFLP